MTMLANLEKYKITLASNSPRRKELLSGLGINYTVKTLPDIDESFPDDMQKEEIPTFIAANKAKAYYEIMQSDELLITADTIVWVNGEVLGKPIDKDDAYLMLRKLSGVSHSVITGVCLTTKTWQKQFHAVTEVDFAELTDEEINYYIDHYKPYDKAGAYGVQEWIGYIAVRSMEGSYFNVMGLPVQMLYTELKEIG